MESIESQRANDVFILPACGATEVFSDLGVLYAKNELEPGQISFGECFLNLNKYGIKDILHGDWQHLVGVKSWKKLKTRPKIPESISNKTHYQKITKKWATPRTQTVSELLVYRTSETVGRNSYFECGHYLSVPSFLHLLYFMVILLFFSFWCQFFITKKMLNKFKTKPTFTPLDSDPPTPRSVNHHNHTYPYSYLVNSDDFTNILTYYSPQKKGVQLVVIGTGEVSPYISTSSNHNPLRQVVIRVSGPNNLSHLQTSALTASQSALCLLMHKPTKLLQSGGVITPASCFGNLLVETLEKNGIVFSVRMSRTVMDGQQEESNNEDNYVNNTDRWSSFYSMLDDNSY